MQTNQIPQAIPSLHRNKKAESGATSLIDLGEPIKPHIGPWVTAADWLMVENADAMTGPAWKETAARSLPLLTYSVSEKENCVAEKRK